MKPRITRADLPEIVAEAERLQAREREDLEAEEAAEVLRELDVSPAHLPEARRLVAERRLARRAKSRRRWALAGVLAAFIAGLVIAFVTVRSAKEAESRLSASGAWVELAGEPVKGPVARETRALLEFEVVLEHPPLGAPLELECSWRDPAGVERYVNRWQTAPITHDRWPTHCRRSFDARDASGTWTVVMSAPRGELASGKFELK